MAEDSEPAVVTAGRVVLAVIVVLAMWLAAIIAAFVGLLTETCGPDATGPECNETFSWIALGIALALFLGSGPVGWLIAGRRWLLAAPLVPVVVSVGTGIVVALQ